MLQELWISCDFRSSDHGRHLLEAVHSEAKRRGWQMIEVALPPMAIQLYNGYAVSTRRGDIGLEDCARARGYDSASRPRMIENLDADAVLTPTASGLPLRPSWRVSAIKSFFMVRSDTMVFSRLVDREPKPARLKGAEPGRRRPVGGEARPQPYKRRPSRSFVLPTQCDLLTPVSDHRTQMRSIRRQVQCLGNWQANHLPGSFLHLDSVDRRVKGFGTTLSLLLANVQGK